MKLPPNSGPVSNLLRIGESTLLRYIIFFYSTIDYMINYFSSSSMDNLRIWDLSDNTTSSYPFTLLPGHTGGFISSMSKLQPFVLPSVLNENIYLLLSAL
jgi:hypothetical protein